jgi:23S rRNA (adenine2503-C2)-methyltransferase
MEIFNLENFLKSEPKYRLEQIKRAVFVDLIENWDEATALPKELRDKLNQECPLDIEAKVFESKDKKTIKALIFLEDGERIEGVLMRYEKDKSRNTACVSSQVGCVLGCGFCATGKMGFKRNLSVDEIVKQILFWARWLKNNETLRQAQGENKINNLVFMGMGEPFLNYENVMSAIKILNDQKGFNLGARHFSISTAGIVDGIKKLADEPLQINLAISLHAPDDELRSKLMPINKKYPIKKIMEAVDAYIKKTNRKVMFEYIMIDNINDSDKQAKELAKLMKRSFCRIRQAQCKFVNLIPCNRVGDFKPSPQARIEKFKKILKRAGVQVNQRYSFGQDIQAACGQLAGKAASNRIIDIE